MKTRNRAALSLSLLLAGSLSARAAAISPSGQRLSEELDAMDVEHHWIAGSHVNWRTGDPDRGTADKSHCSVFVAAALERLGVYILRPPDHGQVHLATAQQDWLAAEGAAHGWHSVDSPFDAQRLANEGSVVIAIFGSDDPKKPGHIAIVRPTERSRAEIERDGPQVIQAGIENAGSTALREGFRHHHGAWESARRHRVLFFRHDWTGEKH
jgi:hypothetical protein